MTTSRIPSDYYTSDELTYKNNTTRSIPNKNSSYVLSNNKGVITKKTRNGSYNIIEKDFGDYKTIYHIPIEYGDDFDITQLEATPIIEEQQKNSPKLVRRRIYQQYENSNYDDDDDDDYEYVEEIPIISPRRRVYISPRRQKREGQIIERIYEPLPTTQPVEYVYEDDYSDVYEYRPENEEEIEYVVRDRVPKQTYMEEPRPTRRTVYVQDPSVPLPSPRPPPPPPPPPASYSPRRSPHNVAVSYQPSPSPAPVKPIRRNDLSPPPSTRKQQNARSPIHEAPSRLNAPNNNEPPPLRLMDVIAQNRAKRGSRIPKPKREIDEERIYDPPTYNRNIIKNGFIVHK